MKAWKKKGFWPFASWVYIDLETGEILDTVFRGLMPGWYGPYPQSWETRQQAMQAVEKDNA